MQDRISVNPGRVLITPENGGSAYYATMIRADNPTQNGTPLNKASLLRDATAALFGLGADAVPDDVFSVLSRFQNGLGNEYVWAKIAVGTKTVYDVSNISQQQLTSPTKAFYYSSSFHIEGNLFVLDNPTSVAWPYSSIDVSVLTGKYCMTGGKTSNESMFFLRNGATKVESNFYSSTSGSDFYQNIREVESSEVVGYVNSPDPNAYPVDDGYTYTALGQLGNKVQIATGSYTGTGTYGESNPNSLTFDFAPKMIIAVYGGKAYNGQLYYPILMLLNPLDAWVNSYSGNSGIGGAKTVVTWSGNTVSWYSTADVNSQLNASGTTCHYIAIG